MIAIEQARVSLGGKEILKGIDLNIPRGGITAMIGPNGAGKSTLLSAICRLTPLDSGRISIDGLPVDATPSRELALLMTFMGQENMVGGRLRVRELVQFGRFPYHQGRPKADDMAAVDRALDLFNLRPIENQFVDTLSGGERQRTRVAMCFCQDTDYFLLDEPLNNLDIYYARELMRTLRTVADESGRTIIIVLHDINHAVNFADRIIALKDGAVLAQGETGEIMVPDTLEALFGYRIGVERVGGSTVCMHFV